jgi:multiple sugar transport system ATP-binding protein
MATIKLEGLEKRFGNVVAVAGIDLAIADGEFVVLVGPSGCGKSTTLRMVAGLEPVSGGKIKFDQYVVNNLTPKNRDIAMVFQSYALYPHMTVFDNMSFGLRLKGVGRDEIKRRVREAAAMLNITELLARKPRELSGGQRQRVAMGRAIVRQPKAFLFDEPLSNLDASLRAQMRVEIKRLHKKLETTVIYVTHDQIEAMTLADRIVIMKDGRIVQVGRPMEVYEHPSTASSRASSGHRR